MRARDHGVVVGVGRPGPYNAITDVDGVSVGHVTLVEGDGPLHIGHGPVRTGVTVVVPHNGRPAVEPLFASYHRLNGFGELTGVDWMHESGLLASSIALTNTNSLGVVRDTVIRREADVPGPTPIVLPVVGETWDGILNDIVGQHVRPEHVHAAFDNASRGPVAEGNVGAGTGLQCYGFKGGIGTASRVVAVPGGEYGVGVLVQANHGDRRTFEVNGVPVGHVLDRSVVPIPVPSDEPAHPGGTGSVVTVVATDAPLLPHQLRRVAQRAALGISKFGARGDTYSGDLVVAFSTAARGLPDMGPGRRTPVELSVGMLALAFMDRLFSGVIEATAEAILNAMLVAQTMSGRDGLTLHALGGERLAEILARYGRARFPLHDV